MSESDELWTICFIEMHGDVAGGACLAKNKAIRTVEGEENSSESRVLVCSSCNLQPVFADIGIDVDVRSRCMRCSRMDLHLRLLSPRGMFKLCGQTCGLKHFPMLQNSLSTPRFWFMANLAS